MFLVMPNDRTWSTPILSFLYHAGKPGEMPGKAESLWGKQVFHGKRKEE